MKLYIAGNLLVSTEDNMGSMHDRQYHPTKLSKGDRVCYKIEVGENKRHHSIGTINRIMDDGTCVVNWNDKNEVQIEQLENLMPEEKYNYMYNK